MRHILSLSKAEKTQFLNSFDFILSDCDGVLWAVTEPIPEVGEGLRLLQDTGKKVGYITNNSMRTDCEYMEKLAAIGVKDARPDDVVHPVKTIIKYFKDNNFDGAIYFIGDPLFSQILRDAGYVVIETKNEVYQSQQEFGKNIMDALNRESAQDVRAVIMDIDINLSIMKLIQAQIFLKKENCLFILGATDKFIPFTRSLNLFSPVATSTLLQVDSGKEILELGKPGKLLADHLLKHFKITNPKRVILFGDALIQDIAFGASCGFQTLAVLSGATDKDQLFKFAADNNYPDYYADSLADFKKFFHDL